jgi:hypothetical protein
MGKGSARYTRALKSHDVFVARGIVTGRSALGAVRGVYGASTGWAVRAVGQHASLHRAADRDAPTQWYFPPDLWTDLTRPWGAGNG